MEKIIRGIQLIAFLVIFSALAFGQEAEQEVVVAYKFSDTESALFFYHDILPSERFDLGKNFVKGIRFFKQNNNRLVLGVGANTGVIVIDVDKKEIVGKLLDGIKILKIDINDNYVYALTNNNELFFLNISNFMTEKIIDLKKLDNGNTFNLAVSRNFVYVAEGKSKSMVKIFRFDKNGNEKFIGKTPSNNLSIEKTLVVSSNDENHIYITLKNRVVEFDLSTNKSRSILTSMTLPENVCFDEKTQTLSILSNLFIETIDIKTANKRQFLAGNSNLTKLGGVIVANNGFVFAFISDTANMTNSNTKEIAVTLVKINLETGQITGIPEQTMINEDPAVGGIDILK